ncbi:PAS-domain containing protein [Allorhizobium sp. BGMRC 0089]|nr:PAS-domain containing protein [Allorhizobium sonneratiae]
MQAEAGLLAIACRKIEDLTIPAFVKDDQLRFMAVNAAFEQFFGQPAECLRGRRISDVTRRPEDQAWEEVERRCLTSGEEQLALCFGQQSWSIERLQIERFLDEEGSAYIFGLSRKADGSVQRSGRTMRDGGYQPGRILSRTLATEEAALKPSWRMMVDHLPMAGLHIGADGRIMHANPEAQSLLAGWQIDLTVSTHIQTFLTRLQPLDETGVALEGKHVGLDDLCRDQGRMFSDRLRQAPCLCLWARRLPQADYLIFATAAPRRAHADDSREDDLYRIALEHVPEPVFLRDSQRRLIFANAAYETYLGKERSLFYGMREDEMFPETGEIMREENIGVLKTGNSLEIEQVVSLPNGEVLPVLTSLKRIQTAAGEPFIVGTFADLSLVKVREREMEQARQEAEHLCQDMDTILRDMPTGVMILNEDLIVSFSNDRARNMLKWPEGLDLNGVGLRDFLDIAYTNGWPLIDGLDQAGSVARRSEDYEKLQGADFRTVEFVDGRQYVLNLSRLSDRKIVVVMTDFSESRQYRREIDDAKAQLSALGALLQDATAGMAQGLCVLEKARVVFTNGKYADLMDIPPELLMKGVPLQDIYDYCGRRGDFGSDPETLRLSLLRQLDVDGHVSFEFQCGEAQWLRLDITGNYRERLLILATDISSDKRRETELTELAHQAKAADRTKSRFLANMGHEFRTPMNGVLGMAELLAASNLDARQKTFVDVILKSGRSILTMINDIIEFSRIDGGQITLSATPFDPVEAVEEVVSFMAGEARQSGSQIIARGSTRLRHMLKGDVGRFRQILTVLLGASLQATQEGHVLIDLNEDVQAEESMVNLRIEIVDNGHGLTREQIGQAFSRFAPMEEEGSHWRGGAGLSFNIATGLVKAFGGEIALNSEVDRGVTVRVTLPFAMSGERQDRIASAALQGARVLAFDSHPLACDSLLEHLLQWQFDAAAVNDWHMACSILEAAADAGDPIEVLIVDLFAPHKGGAALLAWLRGDPRFADLAVLLITADGVGHGRMTDLGGGLRAELIKPVLARPMLSAVSDLLRQRRRIVRMNAKDQIGTGGADNEVTPLSEDTNQGCDEEDMELGSRRQRMS